MRVPHSTPDIEAAQGFDVPPPSLPPSSAHVAEEFPYILICYAVSAVWCRLILSQTLLILYPALSPPTPAFSNSTTSIPSIMALAQGSRNW